MKDQIEKQAIEEMAQDLNMLDTLQCDFRYSVNYQRAKGLYSLGYRKQEWISVDERLPHWSDGKVLVFTKYGFSICERTVNSRWKGQHANWITHWMPLPEPPKMKGD